MMSTQDEYSGLAEDDVFKHGVPPPSLELQRAVLCAQNGAKVHNLRYYVAWEWDLSVTFNWGAWPDDGSLCLSLLYSHPPAIVYTAPFDEFNLDEAIVAARRHVGWPVAG